MNEYIKRKNLVDLVLSKLKYLGDARIMNEGDEKVLSEIDGYEKALQGVHELILDKDLIENVQPVKRCRMIPLEPDCRNYTDVFICTNCHQHIHLGFIRKEYSGNYCLECGAEVLEGDS